MIVVEKVDEAPVAATARDLLEVGKGMVKSAHAYSLAAAAVAD